MDNVDMQNQSESKLREQLLGEQLLKISQKLAELGLNKGASGNASVRCEDGFLVTPSGIGAEEMTPGSMVKMQFDGSFEPRKTPSTEWRFHRDILVNRPEVNAIIHTHSMFASTLSTLRRDMPAFHYMIALCGGDSIRCAQYALFGTQQLSDYAVIALQGRKACLLANHGMIAVGASLEKALNVAQEVETLCEQYLRALQVGEPYILSQQEMLDVQEKFKGYGAWSEK
jgi:L-fuculose-phosphate aldolase